MNNKTIVDIFVDGARKGWNIAVASIVPNVIMAFAVIQVLKITGLLQLLGNVFAPVMAIFGLPGEAAMVLLAAWIANGGGVGVAASLFTAGTLNDAHVTILLPAIFLMGAQLQFMGRCLGTIGVQSGLYAAYFSISVINAMGAMLLTRLILSFY